MLEQYKLFHFIGIGGVGMSAIAHVLNKLGFIVSGSDESKSTITDKLQNEGIKIYIGHARGQLENCQVVVVSSAIKENNPELMQAKEENIPVFHRADLLAQLINSHFGIAIAGAHGKTTTTSMLSYVTLKSNLDPTFLIGGEVFALGGNANVGKSKYLIAEADESDGSFLKFFPKISVITNIENDHMDHYKTMDNMKNAFVQFLGQTSDVAVLCFEDKLLVDIAKKAQCKIISYGIEQKADYQARNIDYNKEKTQYDLFYKDEFLSKVTLVVPGRHNVLNSLAVIAVSLFIGLDIKDITANLSTFAGAKRRFQIKGESNGVLVVDDYAHHPSEIKTTLQAAHQVKQKELICIFQPHRYSRTKLLKDEFATCFNPCDKLILTDIYAASELPMEGIDGMTLVDAVKQMDRDDVMYFPDMIKIADYLKDTVKKGDLVITLGAGDIYKVGEKLLLQLQKEENR